MSASGAAPSLQLPTVTCPVLGLGLFAERCNREVQPVSQLSVGIPGHHAGVQSQCEQPAVGIRNGVNVTEIDAVGDGFSLRDEGFPLIGRLAQFPKNGFDEVFVAEIRATARPRHDDSIVDPSDQRQFIFAGQLPPGDAASFRYQTK